MYRPLFSMDSLFNYQIAENDPCYKEYKNQSEGQKQ